jgi:hypothetical protein
MMPSPVDIISAKTESILGRNKKRCERKIPIKIVGVKSRTHSTTLDSMSTGVLFSSSSGPAGNMPCSSFWDNLACPTDAAATPSFVSGKLFLGFDCASATEISDGGCPVSQYSKVAINL